MTATPIKNNPDVYSVSTWTNYAEVFSSVMTSVQLEVYKTACLHLTGNVVDFGCGTAKIAPFLADNPKVLSYTGIDYAEDMIKVAQQVFKTIGKPNYKAQHGKIEKAQGCYTSAVSIQSYYAWSNPVATLKHIYTLLEKNALFVLATPNKSLQLATLAKELEKELIGHPNLQVYKEYNLKLAANPNAHFINMAKLSHQVQQTGFQIIEAHQIFFNGGINFLVMKK
jgi:2-polyprenyl-3-methyl-5-hydroxy-6-metoxy-1,4-benzoquinol methylase